MRIDTLNQYGVKFFGHGYEKECPYGSQLSVGADIGIQSNYTVITAMDIVTNDQVFMWRFCPGTSANWNMNYDALEWTFNYFRTPIAVDCTGAGTTLPYEMPRRGVPLVEWGDGETKMMWSISNKPTIFEHMRTLIGKGEVRFFNLPEIKAELKSIQWMPQPSGKMKIAPKNRKANDDIATSLALACMPLETKNLTYNPSAPVVHYGKRSSWLTEEW